MAILNSVLRAVRPLVGRTMRGINPAATRAVRNTSGRRIGRMPLTNPNAGRFLNPETGLPRRGLGTSATTASIPRRLSYTINRGFGTVYNNPVGRNAMLIGGGALVDNMIFGALYGLPSGEPQTMPQQYNPQNSVYTMQSNPYQIVAPRPDEKQMQYEFDRQQRNQYYAGLYQQAIMEDAARANMTIEQAQALQAQMNGMYGNYSAALGGGMYE